MVTAAGKGLSLSVERCMISVWWVDDPPSCGRPVTAEWQLLMVRAGGGFRRDDPALGPDL